MMRKIFTVLLVTVFLQGLIPQTASADISRKGKSTFAADTMLKGIQLKIEEAFLQSLNLENDRMLLDLKEKLETSAGDTNHPTITYWQAYLQFYLSLYYLETGNRKAASGAIDEGIQLLEKAKGKSSEDYALLSMLQGFGLQFKGMQAMFIASRVKKNAKTAIALDSNNLRAYYVYASNDFYTPEAYGGGKECEKYLLKAISLPVQKEKSDYLPSWGKEESYELLVRYYMRKDKRDLAKKYVHEALREFPDSYSLKKLEEKLYQIDL